MDSIQKQLAGLVTTSTDLDYSKLPLKLRMFLSNCMVTTFPDVPVESMLLDVLTKVAQVMALNRTKVVSLQFGEVVANIYALIFMPSGAGKDKPLKMIDKYFLDDFEEVFNERKEAFIKLKLAKLEEEASTKFPGLKAAKTMYIKEKLPRDLITEYSQATTEGLADLRGAFSQAGFGGTFLKISEFSDFISSANNARGEFLSYVVEIFDDGSSAAKVIKSDKTSVSIKGVPSNTMMHSSLSNLVDSEGFVKLMTLVNRGLARRTFMCYPPPEKFIKKQESFENLENQFLQEIESKKNLQAIVDEYKPMWTQLLQGGEFAGEYILTEDAEKLLFYYRKYLDLTTNSISIYKDEGYRAEISGRFWKALKLSAIIAAFEHPLEDKVDKTDMEAAIYITELYGQHFKRFYNIETVSDVEKLMDYLIDRKDKWVTKTDISKQRFISQKNFANWIDGAIAEAENLMLVRGFKLEREKFSKNGIQYKVVELEKEDGKTVNLSISSDITENFMTKKVKWEEVYKAVSWNGNYSASTFREGYRDKAHWIDGNNIIILDIDEGWTIEEAKEFLVKRKLQALIATTKSHQKVKDKKKACDRFRIILPTSTPFRGTAEQYSFMMGEIFKYFLNKPDKAARDVSRFYFGNPNSEYWYFEGELFNIEMFARETEYKSKSKDKKPNSIDSITEWFKENATPGNRNDTLNKARLFAKDNGLDPGVYVRQINLMLSDPIEERELKVLLRE